jgi:hypothetical protein
MRGNGKKGFEEIVYQKSLFWIGVLEKWRFMYKNHNLDVWD